MEAIVRDQVEMNPIVIERKVEADLQKKLTYFADHIFCMAELAPLCFKNDEKRIGPFVVTSFEGRMVTV